MIIAKVMGTAVASAKHAALSSTKLLIVCPTNIDGETSSDPFLAVDLVGSGQGELVIVSQGSSARLATDYKNSPVDAAIVGIIDSLQYDNKLRFRKE
jgi:microcompartment protein CcmK/EutM